MAGVQVSNLLANSPFDWKSVVDQLIAADSIPINKLNADKAKNTDRINALAGLKTSMMDLQDSVQSIRSGDLFSLRNVTTDNAANTWKSNSASGATIGSYTFAISQLATQSTLQGTANVGAGLSATSDVSGLTLANLATATAVTAGTFTVNGNAVTIALTDSLQDVFDKIATATGNEVTASYAPASDGITLTSVSGEIVLGAANDTSNFLGVMKLANNGTGTISSSAALGTVKLSAPLASSGLATISAVDGSGNGSFTINGVSIGYNVNTDTLGAVLSRINNSTAGVTASYDSANDRVTLTNKTTGDIGLAASETSGGLLDALGLNGATGTLTRGKNAQFTVNGGPVLSSQSNTLDASVHGITGLSVTVNSQTTQTITVESDIASMQGAIQDFVDKFNAVQDFIDTNTKVDVSGTNVTTAVLSDNREIQSWARQLQQMAFDVVSGVTGSVQRITDMGIDFDSISGHLKIKDNDKLVTALSDRPDDVKSFFTKANTGVISKLFSFLNNAVASDNDQQDRITKDSASLDKQIADLQARLDSEREQLTNSFIQMLDAQSKAQSQNTYLTNTFFKNSSNN